MDTKRVLFIGIGFYDYDQSIIDEFKKLNYEVDYFCEVPRNSFSFRLYSRLNKQKQLNKIIESNNEKLVKKCSTNYSLIFIIKAEYLSEKSIIEIKKKNTSAKTVLYLWDSIIRINKIETKFKHFDKVFSFDRIDCLNNELLNFNALFYRDEYIEYSAAQKISNDVYHLGWYHSDRLELVKKIDAFCKQNNINCNLILFTGYFSYFFNQIFGGELKRNKKYLIFRSISAKENRKNIMESKAVLDIAHPLQSGLTIRTIELLGMGRKIITTNSDIVNYDFYNPSNVYVIDRDNPKFELSFFSAPYEPVSPLILEYYSIQNWLQRMINS